MTRATVRIHIAALTRVVGFTIAGTARASGPAPTQAQVQFEVRFLTEMIDHHAMAVEMAQICLSNAVHEELRTMCSHVITAQSQEIFTMQMWLQSWYGINRPR